MMGNEHQLEHAFTRTLQELRASGADVQALMEEFTATEPFDLYQTGAHREGNISIEEAFYHFLRQQPLFPEGSVPFYLLTHEFLTALLTKVASGAEPPFVIETWQVRDNGTMRYALQRVPMKKAETMCGQTLSGDRDKLVIWLYAATKNGFVSEVISPFAAEVLEFKTPALLKLVQDDLMSKYDLTADDFHTHVQELRDRGLIASA